MGPNEEKLVALSACALIEMHLTRIQIANLRPTVIQLLSPFLFMILLFVLQQLYNHDQREKCTDALDSIECPT